MSHLELTFFGSPQIALNGNPLNNRIDKAVALVALLAIQGPTLHRDSLITSLWSNSSLTKAQAALRAALWRLKDAGLTPWLEIEREFITLNKNDSIWIDTEEFREKLENSKQPAHDKTTSCRICSPLLERAVELYRGDFMAGYSPRNAVGFDEWRVQFAQIMRNEYLAALERLVKGYHTQGLYAQALQMARRWLALEPYNEYAHSMIIRSYASSDQRANAITHYRTYKRLVEKNLNIPPAEKITTLYKQITTGKNPPPMASEPLKDPALLLLDIPHIPELWVKHGSLMEQVIDRFSSIVKDGLRRCGGRIIKQTGESFAIYFDQGNPLQCAIAIQRLVADTKWGLPDRLAVRMVITTVPGSQAGYPEYTPDLSSCRQLLQAASGNQILITEQATQTLEVPLSSQVRDLGIYAIPGQINPLQVYELVHPHLPVSEQSGLQNLLRSPANLPIQSTHFVGRETELKQIASLLAQPVCRLLTLVGPGGVGKTRLGIEAINQLQAALLHDIYYVPLAAHTNPLTIYTPIADALNLSFNNPGDQVAQLIDHIRHKKIFLLLDNFEHLIPAAPFLVKLLESTPGLRLMLTSRERLNLHLESIFEVHGLPFPNDPDDPDFDHYSGIRLFTQNAHRVSPRFVLHPDDRSHLIRICKLVDGLPLGIELSSAWVRALTCEEIANSIDQNLDFAKTESPDVPDRHRSLRAAFYHSWKLLSEEARRTIGKLSVFRDGFSVPAAEHLAHATPLMLASYVDKCLLSRQTNGRYLMPETLRAYVLENIKADALEYESLLDAHSEYYINYLIGMFAVLTGETGAAAIKELGLDSDNIRDAITWAIDRHHWPLLLKSIDPLMTCFELQGRLREGRDIASAILARIVDICGLQQPDIYYLLLGWEGSFSFRLGSTQAGLASMKAQLEYAQSQGDLIHTANALRQLADAHRRLGNLTIALEEISQSLELLGPVSSSDNQPLLSIYVSVLAILGVIQLRLGNLDAARQAAFQGYAVVEKSGIYYTKIRLSELQSRIAIREQRYQESLDLRLKALAIAEDFHDRRNIAILLNNLSDSAEHLNDMQGAFAYMAKAEQISDEIGYRQVSALCNNNLGYLTIYFKNSPADAIPYYQKSLDLYREICNTHGILFTLRDISQAYLLAGSAQPARSHLIEALELGIELDEPHLVMQLLPTIARFQAQSGQPARAAQLCRLVIDHPKVGPDLKKNAEQVQAVLIGQPPDVFALDPSIVLELPTFQSLLAEIKE